MPNFEARAIFQAEQCFDIEADTMEEANSMAIDKADEIAGMNMSFDNVCVSYVEVEENDEFN